MLGSGMGNRLVRVGRRGARIVRRLRRCLVVRDEQAGQSLATAQLAAGGCERVGEVQGFKASAMGEFDRVGRSLPVQVGLGDEVVHWRRECPVRDRAVVLL